MTCQRCPHWNPVSGLGSYGAARPTSTVIMEHDPINRLATSTDHPIVYICVLITVTSLGCLTTQIYFHIHQLKRDSLVLCLGFVQKSLQQNMQKGDEKPSVHYQCATFENVHLFAYLKEQYDSEKQ